MSFWVLVQILVNLLLLTSTVILWLKLNRPAKDDPRLSKGLQLLQSKISVLEDLSDRTDTQVNQLISLIEQKTKELQNQIVKSDKQIQNIESSMGRSLEVAKIFQDKIPHQEIIERQNTIKYVKAATLAHQGATVEEIAREVDLSMGEIEFIAKVNKDELQFSIEDLPDWATEEINLKHQPAPEPSITKTSLNPMSELGEKFRQVMNSPQIIENNKIEVPTPQVSAQAMATRPKNLDGEVRKVVFPKIDVTKNLV
jgi:hypothetical protein